MWIPVAPAGSWAVRTFYFAGLRWIRRPTLGPDLSGQRNAAMKRCKCGFHLSPFGVFYIWQHIIGARLGWGTKKKKKKKEDQKKEAGRDGSEGEEGMERVIEKCICAFVFV